MTSTPWDLRLGRWEDALADVSEVDAVITDPPYSDRTHGAAYEGETDSGHREWVGDAYASWSLDDARGFVGAWAPRCRGWFCVMTDHVLAPAFSAAMESAGRYTFAPIPVIERGRNVRLAGDGPACWALWLIVSRPRSLSRWGSLPGGYVVGRDDKIVTGGKGLPLMRAIVRDYSRPGDLVCDPCAGGGTSLLAAAIEGRRAIGAEMDATTYAKARERIEAGYTPDLFGALEERREPVQVDLFGEAKP